MKKKRISKILIIRFSSIGDIVLTTPIIRSIYLQIPDCEIHYLTKDTYLSLVEFNPYIQKVWTIQKNTKEILSELRLEKFDFVVDLHKNLRSIPLKILLGRKNGTYNKQNFLKMLKVRFKIDKLPQTHIVERYFEAVKKIEVANDHKGLDFFIDEKKSIEIKSVHPELASGFYIIVMGGHQFTKRLPKEKIVELSNQLDKPIVLLGGKEQWDEAEHVLIESTAKTINLCGKFSIQESAQIIRDALLVVTNDTGFMHISAALKKKILSVWGSTIPEFGMTPYYPEKEYSKLSKIFEVKDLSCRPCHKLGYEACPKKHFDCMYKMDMSAIAKSIKREL